MMTWRQQEWCTIPYNSSYRSINPLSSATCCSISKKACNANMRNHRETCVLPPVAKCCTAFGCATACVACGQYPIRSSLSLRMQVTDNRGHPPHQRHINRLPSSFNWRWCFNSHKSQLSSSHSPSSSCDASLLSVAAMFASPTSDCLVEWCTDEDSANKQVNLGASVRFVWCFDHAHLPV
jgi:hypothetical protein